jgi:hypothetical protein
MPFDSSTYGQRLIDLILEIRPKSRTERIATDPPRRRLLPHWDPFECSSADIAAIRSDLDGMALVTVPVINSWPGVGKELANRLAGLSEDTIAIGCQDCAGPQFVSSSGLIPNPTGKIKYTMGICPDVAHPSDVYYRRTLIQYYVFRELIALAGGTALDQYGLWTYFVVTHQGQFPVGPLPGELSLMCAESTPLGSPPTGWRAGRFMVWSNATGHFGVGEKVDPTRSVLVLNYSTLLQWRSTCP